MKSEIKERIAQIRRGEVPRGYKKANNKIVPQEWQSVSLGELGEARNGLNFSRAENGHRIRMLGVGDFQKHTILREVTFLTEVSLNTFPEEDALLQDGDIVFVRSNGSKELVGRNLLVYPGENLAAFSGFCIRYRMRPNEITTPEYINYWLDTGALKEKLQRENQGSDITNLNQGTLCSLTVCLPGLEEQRRIAEILTAQDKIIALKEQRLAEKRRQKTGLAQRLLTGKTRLPGFDGEWKTERLGALFAERVETKREDLELLAITASQGVIPRSRLDLKDNSSEDKSKYLRVCVGDIGYNTMRMWQGVSAYSNYEGIVSPAYTVLKPSADVCAKYFAYLFKTPKIVFQFYRHSQGLVDDTRNLKYANFKKISVVYPPNLEEQQAIAEVLTCADREIEALQRDLELEKRKKKALMQLLLTGVVRVNSRLRSA